MFFHELVAQDPSPNAEEKWKFMIEQKGQFTTLPLTPAQAYAMLRDHKIYIGYDGRIVVSNITD